MHAIMLLDNCKIRQILIKKKKSVLKVYKKLCIHGNSPCLNMFCFIACCLPGHQENVSACPIELYVLMSLEYSVLKICLMFTGKAKQTNKTKIFFSDVCRVLLSFRF